MSCLTIPFQSLREKWIYSLRQRRRIPDYLEEKIKKTSLHPAGFVVYLY